MSNSPIESPKILFRAKSKIATLNMHKSQESNLFFESMSNLSKAQADEILSPNPIQDILNRDIGDNDLSLGMSPQLLSLGMSPQLQSPQFQLRSMMLQKASSKHFEDSIDLKENESPTIQPLPMVNESPKKDFLDSINIGEKPPVSGTLKGSQMFFYPNQNYPETDTLKNSEASFIDNSSPTLNGIKNSGYLMQSPQLDALEKYINKEEEKDKEKVKDNSKSDSRPGSGDSFLENNSPYKSKQISISPMKKFQKNLDEEKLTLVENIIKEEEEKKEIDQEFKNNELEMNNSKLKIDDEIKKGHLNKIKSIENVDDIVEFKKIYHNFFYLNNLLKKIYWKYLFYNLGIIFLFF